MKRRFDFCPEEPAVEPKTVQALKSWMEECGCNFQSYQIDSLPILEGYILAEVRDTFHWIFTERGVETVVRVFGNETDAVSYAYEKIKADGWAWSHVVGFVKTKKELMALKSSLEKLQIPYHEDSIPYGGKSDIRYRVFVHGSAAELVSELREEYFNYRDE